MEGIIQRKRREYQSQNRGGIQGPPIRDFNAINVDREREKDRICYAYRKWSHIAKNCWSWKKRRIVEMLQESAKDNRGQ